MLDNVKTILILEDSSRVDFGGGQKMTLITSNILKSKYNLRFIDFAATTRYAYTIKHQYGNENFVDIGHMRIRGQGGWLSWLIMVLLSMVYLFYDTKRILRNIDYNKCICYSTNKRTLIVAAFLRWRYNIPYVHHAHLVEKNNILRNLFINRLFKCAEFVLCVSNVVKESIGTPNCKLLYNPSNNIRGYKGVKKDNKFIVAFVGSLIPIKGVEYFIDAAKYCPKHIEFRIYGDGPLREVLKKRSDGRVIFMGFDN